jgi:hypothetical protein
MKRKLGTRKRKQKKLKKQGFRLFEHPFSRIDKEVLKEAILSTGKKSSDKFPSLLESLLGRFSRWYPPFIISTIATYGLQAGVTDQGVSSEGIVRKIQQHHVEVLQALALTLPHAEWGSEPAPPEVIQQIIDEAIELAQAFLYRRLVAIGEERDEQQRVVLALQERLRAHTQVVRNWGYFSAVVRISKELYGALDQDLSKHFGFSATDLIEVSRALLLVLERRANKRLANLRDIFKARTTDQLVRDYYAKYPYVEGNPEEFLAGIPKGVTTQMVKYRLLAHSDIALVRLGIVDTAELAELVGRPSDVVERVLGRLSLRPGDLDGERAENFFLSNPIWISPGIEIGGGFFFPTPQIIFSHIHPIMSSLAEAAGAKAKLDKRRAAFLETQIRSVVGRVLPDASLTPNVRWMLDGKTYETDLLGQIDRVVLIVEAKSAAVSPEGLRGAPERVKRHVRDLIVDPAEQSHRLEQVILKAKAGDPSSLGITSSLGLDPDEIDTIIRVSVTLDDFSTICSAEKELKAAKWVPEELRLALTLGLADFEIVADVLDEPAYFLHYLAERERVQKTIDIFGDELDYLGFYLETGFNISSLEEGGIALAITGMSQAIDHYYSSLDAGVQVGKPVPRVHPQLARIVQEARRRKATAWSTISLDMLRMGNADEQNRLFSELEKLRENVRKNYLNPEHLCSLVISPPTHREACVIFYVYPEILSGQRHDIVSQLAGNALTEQHRGRCIIVGRKIEAWDRPYQFIGIATPPKV